MFQCSWPQTISQPVCLLFVFYYIYPVGGANMVAKMNTMLMCVRRETQAIQWKCWVHSGANPGPPLLQPCSSKYPRVLMTYPKKVREISSPPYPHLTCQGDDKSELQSVTLERLDLQAARNAAATSAPVVEASEARLTISTIKKIMEHDIGKISLVKINYIDVTWYQSMLRIWSPMPAVLQNNPNILIRTF